MKRKQWINHAANKLGKSEARVPSHSQNIQSLFIIQSWFFWICNIRLKRKEEEFFSFAHKFNIGVIFGSYLYRIVNSQKGLEKIKVNSCLNKFFVMIIIIIFEYFFPQICEALHVFWIESSFMIYSYFNFEQWVYLVCGPV